MPVTSVWVPLSVLLSLLPKICGELVTFGSGGRCEVLRRVCTALYACLAFVGGGSSFTQSSYHHHHSWWCARQDSICVYSTWTREETTHKGPTAADPAKNTAATYPSLDHPTFHRDATTTLTKNRTRASAVLLLQFAELLRSLAVGG